MTKPTQDAVRVCFVCLGNICRSPTAEAVMRHLVKQAGLDGVVEVESAGTGDWHVGELRDRRSRDVGEQRAIPLSGRARQFVASDFARFDWVLAMDGRNLNDLRAMAPDQAARDRIRLLRSFDPASSPDADVPDPYFGGDDGFERVFDICVAACTGLLATIRAERGI
ncbi:MAG TPA: low molecular weight protein-tyrosine-phosphatase [Polyangia bacterium]|jgi:protein-tyrosine phosphatase|nr:low molecular weight protein-tyrosine-phosphatase [Polyangia bacterium]